MQRVLATALASALLLPILAACNAQPDADTAAPAATDVEAAAATDTAAAAPAAPADALAAAVAGDWRDPANVARDSARHPAETLAFFGIEPGQTVVEITPGGGWYTEILAPYLRDGGHYVGAIWADGASDYYDKTNAKLREKVAATPAAYDQAEWRAFDPKSPQFGPAGSADAVLTFRNVHNWVNSDAGEAYFKAFFDVLKPGGTLGVVEHRAKPDTDLETMKKSGYLTEALVIELAEKAGFELVEKSEANANPNDTADHPNGVWTLPPGNRHDEADAAKYEAIGESDRMTLRFRKPEA